MKKNHINFAHPNKWSDSLAPLVESSSVATEIPMGRRTKNRYLEKIEFRVTTIIIMGNYEKPQK